MLATPHTEYRDHLGFSSERKDILVDQIKIILGCHKEMQRSFPLQVRHNSGVLSYLELVPFSRSASANGLQHMQAQTQELPGQTLTSKVSLYMDKLRPEKELLELKQSVGQGRKCYHPNGVQMGTRAKHSETLQLYGS